MDFANPNTPAIVDLASQKLSLVDDVQPYDVGATFIDDLRTQMVEAHDAPALLMERPTSGEIIEHLATYYGTSEDTVTCWLVDLVKELES